MSTRRRAHVAAPALVALCAGATLTGPRVASAQRADALSPPAGAVPPSAAPATIGTAAAPPATAEYVPPTARERRRAYGNELVSPGTALLIGSLAGIDQWQDDPTGWRQGANGYGRRLLSRTGGVAAQITLEHGIAAGLRHDLRYEPLGHGSRGARVWHAVSGAVLARRPDGRRTLSVGTVAGAYGGRLAETAWQPGGARPGNAAAALGYNLAARALINVAREFGR